MVSNNIQDYIQVTQIYGKPILLLCFIKRYHATLYFGHEAISLLPFLSEKHICILLLIPALHYLICCYMELYKHIYTQAQCIIVVLWKYKDVISNYSLILGDLNSVEK